MIVIAEADGIAGDFTSYIVRTLLSEGRLIYGTVEKGDDGHMQPRRIERDGPTGVIITTTAVRLHPENETRLLSVPVDDTQAQTRRVMASLACVGGRAAVDFGQWHALAKWLESGERRVFIPFAEQLARLIPPVAVRLRRDFGQLLNLVAAHALLHRANRATGDNGVVATIEDYAVVRELVADLMGESAAHTVSTSVRETVGAVARAIASGKPYASIADVAELLALDKSTASRRVRAAREAGYLENSETKKGVAAKLVLGDPLPEERDLLPTPEVLQRCSVSEGVSDTPLPPSEPAGVEAEAGANGVELF